jgi:hypothetical protein
MPGKVKIQPVSRMGTPPLVEMAEGLRAGLPGWENPASPPDASTPVSDLASDLEHLARHDRDGFLLASIDEEVVGFCTSFVRSRHVLVSNLWLLPEHREEPVARNLLRRALTHGERAGVSGYAGHWIGGAWQEALAFRFGLRPRFPVFRLALGAETARTAGEELARLLPGTEVTEEGLHKRAGWGDLERIDRLTRAVARPMDHEYWLAGRRLRLAMVRDGQRIAAYAYGGAGQCGPVAATTQEAGLAALGWALRLAAEASTGGDVALLVPAVFEAAVEQLLDAGAHCLSSGQWMSRQTSAGLERCVLASTTLL